MNNRARTREWHVTEILAGSAKGRYACILLNQPILPQYKELIGSIWAKATLRLCADGAANRLYDSFEGEGLLPHEIRGDMDSARPEVLSFFRSKGVTTTTAASQYATDLQKCILAVEEYEAKHGVKGDERLTVVILGGLSGRLDQTMHTFHVLCQLSPTSSNDEEETQIVARKQNKSLANVEDFVTLDKRPTTIAVSENSVAWLLTQGEHTISIEHDIVGKTCGLLPFAAKLTKEEKGGTRIWTEGLEWDLNGEESAIGAFLSTSNHLKDKTVKVTTEAPIIWTMEIRVES